MTANWVYDADSFYDFLGLVAQCAPDFPEEDFLSADEQLDLDSAFRELFAGLQFLRDRISPADLLAGRHLLEKSLEAFSLGDEIKGSHFLQELDRLLFAK